MSLLGDNFGPRKNQMSPEDVRNLFVFFIAAILLFLAYDSYVLKPQAERARIEHIKTMEKLAAEEATLPAEEKIDVVIPRAQALAAGPRIEIDNGRIKGSLALRGARLDDIALQEYYETLEKKDNVVLLSPKATTLPRYVEYGWVPAEGETAALPGRDTLWQVQGNSRLTRQTPVTLSWNNGNGLEFQRVYSIDSDYMITVTQRVKNASGRPVTLYPYGLVSQTGMPESQMRSWLLVEGMIGYIGDKLNEVGYTSFFKEPEKTFEATQGWAGINDKYWLTALVPAQGQDVKYTMKYTGSAPKKGKDKVTGRFQVDYTGAALTIAPGASGENKTLLFAGAKKFLMLRDYENNLGIPKFDLAVNFGWFWFLSQPFFYALHFLAQKVGNFGVAIILFTILVRSAVFPLTNTSYKSFAKMKKVTPQVNALRETYGADRGALQAELVKLYEREGVNPMAGCLPMILQIPIFFALYKVLFITIEMRQAPFFGWIQDLSAPDPTNVFNLFGLIPWDPPSMLHIGVWPCLMLSGMLIQRNLNPPPQDPVQRDMALYMPFLVCYMMSRFAAGLVIYWTFSNYISVIQQTIIMRRLGVPIHLFDKDAAEKELAASVNKGPAVHPLVEMAEDEVEDAMFGDDSGSRPVTPPKPKKKKKR